MNESTAGKKAQDYLKNHKDVILFINDIALITRIDGTSNIEEYFSELFSSDDINFIGTCSSDDYKKYIKHLKIVHKKSNKQHTCNHCTKSFVQKENLDRHMSKRHSDNPEYACEKCFKIFKSWWCLN